MPTSREERAAARHTRHNLQFPNHGLGRAELIRSRTPSPTGPGAFNFPQPAPQQLNQAADNFADAEEGNMATQAQLDAIREELRNEMRAEMRNETAAAAATV